MLVLEEEVRLQQEQVFLEELHLVEMVEMEQLLQ
jgi:hypothetical protein